MTIWLKQGYGKRIVSGYKESVGGWGRFSVEVLFEMKPRMRMNAFRKPREEHHK